MILWRYSRCCRGVFILIIIHEYFFVTYPKGSYSFKDVQSAMEFLHREFWQFCVATRRDAKNCVVVVIIIAVLSLMKLRCVVYAFIYYNDIFIISLCF